MPYTSIAESEAPAKSTGYVSLASQYGASSPQSAAKPGLDLSSAVSSGGLSAENAPAQRYVSLASQNAPTPSLTIPTAPTAEEKTDIDTHAASLQSAQKELAALRANINNTDQKSVDSYNTKLADFNTSINDYQTKADAYNAKIDKVNNLNNPITNALDGKTQLSTQAVPDQTTPDIVPPLPGAYAIFRSAMAGNTKPYLDYLAKTSQNIFVQEGDTVEEAVKKVANLVIATTAGDSENIGASIDNIARSQNPTQIADIIEKTFKNISPGDVALYAPRLAAVEDPVIINKVLTMADTSGVIRSSYPAIEKSVADEIAHGAYNLKNEGKSLEQVSAYMNGRIQEALPKELLAGEPVSTDTTVPAQPSEMSPSDVHPIKDIIDRVNTNSNGIYDRVPKPIVTLPPEISKIVGGDTIHLSDFVVAKIKGLISGLGGHSEITDQMISELPQRLAAPLEILKDGEKKYFFINQDPQTRAVVEIGRNAQGITEVSTYHPLGDRTQKQLEKNFPTVYRAPAETASPRIDSDALGRAQAGGVSSPQVSSTIPQREKTATIESANKEYLKQSQDQGKMLPEEKVTIRGATTQIKQRYYAHQEHAADSAFMEIQATLDQAEGPKRYSLDNEKYGDPTMYYQRSSYPNWLPDDLRDGALIRKVFNPEVRQLSDLQYPYRLNAIREARLVNAMYDLIDQRTGQDTSAIRSDIMKMYTPEGRTGAHTEKAINATSEKTAKSIEELIGKDEARKARMERVRAAAEFAQKTIAEAAQKRANYLAEVEQAKLAAKKKPSFIEKLRKVTAPFKNLDPKTQSLYKNWRTNLLLSFETEREMVTKLSEEAELSGFQNSFAEIHNQEAGAKIPYITNATEALYTEAKRAGFNLGWRENHLSLYWDNTPSEKQVAFAKYLKDKGVPDKLAEEVAVDNKDLPSDMALNLKINPSFIKTRTMPDYATGMKYGLTPRYRTPAEIIAHSQGELDRAIANRKFIADLKENGKLLPIEDAPRSWMPIKLPFTSEQLEASPELAKVITSIMNRDMGVFDYKFIHKAAGVVSKLQQIRLSGGPGNIHFFAIGQAIKALTTAVGDIATLDFRTLPSDVKNALDFFKTNFSKPTAEWFTEKQAYFRMMAMEGINTSNRIGGLDKNQWANIYTKMTSGKISKTILGGEKLVEKVFNEKTWGGYMPMMMETTFENAYEHAMKVGGDPEDARKFAGELTKKYYGLIDDMARSGLTEDLMRIFFFAPKFRESLVRFFVNSGRAWTTDIRNPAYAKNRKFIVGAIITYLLYNYINQKEQGHPIWQNGATDVGNVIVNIPDALGKYIPGFKSGDKVKIPFLPSISALARSAIGGAIALGEGDFKTAVQQATGLTSIVFQTLEQAITNSDYFGRKIYQDTDSTGTKLYKIATFMGLAINHPWVQGVIDLINNKLPLYQNISNTLQLPLKFTSDSKLATAAYYDMLAKQTNIKAEKLQQIHPIYDKIKNLVLSGKKDEASALYKNLSAEDQKIFQSIKTSDKRVETLKEERDIFPVVRKVQELVLSGKKDQATTIYEKLSDSQKKAFLAVKKRDFSHD